MQLPLQISFRNMDRSEAIESLVRNRAQERQCDLIVIGTHGRTGITRLLMGSVAEQVVRNATCPVLTVKTASHMAPVANQHVAAAASAAAEATK